MTDQTAWCCDAPGEITRLAPKELLGKKLVLKTQGYYFLFSDLFLFTKPTSSSYEVKVQVDLSRALYKGTPRLLFPLLCSSFCVGPA